MTDAAARVNDLLQSPTRVTKRDVIAETCAMLEAEAVKAYEWRQEEAVKLLLAQPWRIGRSIYGLAFTEADWAPTGSSTYLIEMLTKARSAIRGERKRGKEGHWTFDGARLTGLLQAERALERKIARGDVR